MHTALARYTLFLFVIACVWFNGATASFAQQRVIVNPSFEANDPQGPGAANFQVYTNGEVPGWNSTTGYIELWDNNFRSVPAYQGAVFAEMNAYDGGALYQNICMVNGETVGWTFAHRARSGGAATQTANFQIANSGGTVLQNLASQASTTANQVWNVNSGTTTYTGPSGVQHVQFTTTDPGSVGNFLDDIRIQLNPFIEFSAAAGSGLESNASSNIPALLIDGTLYSPITVSVTVTGGTATRGTDYTTPNGNATFNVTVPAGTYSRTTLPLGITVIDDNLVESSETITLSLNAGTGYTRSGTASCGSAARTTSTYTITDNDSAITLSKEWLNAKAGDTVNLAISGAATATAGSSEAGGAATNATGAAIAGTNITISETFSVGLSANYTPSFSCIRASNGAAVTLTGTGLSRSFAMPATGGVICTITNSRKSSLLSLRKTWVGAQINNSVDISTSGLITDASFNSVANAANETDTGTAFTVYAGDVVQITETFLVGSASRYAATFSCTGNANAVTGNQVTISATDTSVICAYTNTYITPLAFTKISAAYSDPVNGTANPKMIPGGFVDYTLTVTNPASYPVTSDSIFVIDPLPSQVAMFVNTVAPGPGPVVMTPNSSTLT